MKHWILALGLALLSLLALRVASQYTGFVRDEAAYFESSLRIRSWLSQVAQNPSNARSKAERAFRYNREHPGGLKILAALTVADQGNRRDTIPGQTMRWAAHLVAALGVFLLSREAMRRYGVAIGLFCGAAFITLPRVFYHAQLHCFDVAIAVAAILVAQRFSALVTTPNPRTALWLSLAFGAALSIKHNALLFPAFLLSALAWCWLDKKHALLPSTKVLALGALAVLGGLLVFGLAWPWLWTDPLGRWLEYIEFHRHHSYYNMAFLGHNYNQPPLPMAYPWVLTAVTWPLSWITLVLGGAFLALRCHKSLEARSDLVMSLAPIVLIALPNVPIFGGTKHWITAYPFMCLLMGRALFHLRATMKNTGLLASPLFVSIGLVLLWSPALVDNLRSHPHQLAQYSSWYGGPRAAARAGLGRGFWGGLGVPQALTQLTQEDRLFPHDMHPRLVAAYREQEDIDPPRVASRSQANAAFSFHEDHMLIDELWTQRSGFGTRPAWVCSLDDVPLMSLYIREDAPSP